MKIFQTLFAVFVVEFEQTFIARIYFTGVNEENVKNQAFFLFLIPHGNVETAKSNEREIFELKVSSRKNYWRHLRKEK